MFFLSEMKILSILTKTFRLIFVFVNRGFIV